MNRDQWKRSRHVLSNGAVLRVGRRYTATCEIREVLGADVPPFWRIAKVVQHGQVVGFGLHEDQDTAKAQALWQAGLLKPVSDHKHAAHNGRVFARNLRGVWDD